MKQTILGDIQKSISEMAKDDSFQQSIKQGFYRAMITDIKPTTSHKFFVTETYEDREGIEIFIDGGNNFFIPIPTRLIGSQMGSFIQKYGEMPKVEMIIEIDTTERYQRIKLE